MLADIVKIHCLTHGANFPMSRTSRTVVCKEGPEEHILSDNFPNSGLWIYCCNCQTFIAWETRGAGVSVKECPFCLSSLNPRLYSCDHCAVTMLDFDDQTLRKHHTVLTWGMPQPACPGCHQFPKSTPRLHYCAELGCNLSTARAVCPFCHLRTDQTGQINNLTAAPNLNHALEDAETRARDAEERRRLAEEAARKEIALRVEAERKAIEIEQKITRELPSTPAGVSISDQTRREAEIARARAEAEARARSEAEARARAAEERRLQAEAAARREAEARAAVEQKAREFFEINNGGVNRHPARKAGFSRKDRETIAIMGAIAMFLFMALIMLIITLLRLL